MIIVCILTPNTLATDKPVALGFRIELKFRNVGFVERRKPEYPEKNLSEQGENQQQTQPTHDAGRVRESNPGHIGVSRALSPLCHPCSPNKTKQQQQQNVLTVLAVTLQHHAILNP